MVVPVVPWNHSIFEKGAMEPLDFCIYMQWNQSIFKFASFGTTGFKLIAPALYILIIPDRALIEFWSRDSNAYFRQNNIY